jgi:autotransporter-associated beta strand protein
MRKALMRIRVTMLCACILLCALSTVVERGWAGVNWDGGGADDNINTAANWDANTLPALTGASANLFFRGTTRLTPQLNIPINPLGIQFDSTAGAFMIGGVNTLTIGSTTVNGNITNLGSAAQTIDAPLIVNRGTLDAASGDLIVNGTINVGGNSRASGRSLTITGPQQVILNGVIEGTGTGDPTASPGGVITKNGAGILHIVSDSPLWAGRIGINSGIVRIYAPNALGDPTSRTLIQTAAGTTTRLELAGGVTFAPERLEIEGRTTGTSPVHLLNESGSNNWTGNIYLRTGGSEYGFEAAGGELSISGNIINESGNATARIVRFGGAADAAFFGEFQNGSGTGPLTVRKDGIGSWTFTNSAFSHAGDTLVSGGTLAFSSGISINSSPNIQVAPGAILDLSAGSLQRIAGQTLVGGGTILGNVTESGATIRPDVPGMTNSPATLTFADSLVLNGGGTITLDVANDTTVGAGVNDLIDVGGNLSLSGTTNIVIHPLTGVISNGTYRLFNYGGSLSGGAANLQLTFGSTRQTAAISTATAKQVNLVVNGAAANLVWVGDGIVNSWDVNASMNWRNGAAPDKFFNLDNVTFDDSAGPASTVVNVAETVVPGSVTVNSSLDYTFTGGGKISGVAGITKSGTGRLILDINNDNTGTVTISGGTLQVGAGFNTGSLGTGDVVNNGALVFERTTGTTVPGVISGTGTVSQHGPGTVTLEGNNTYTGATTIAAGTLQIGSGGTTGTLGAGSVTNNGVLEFNRGGDLVVASQIGGTGAVEKHGSGSVELSALNTYGGITQINSGTLVVNSLADGGAASSIGQSTSGAANLHIQTNGTLRYVGDGGITDRLFTIGNARLDASGAGPVVFENPGALGTSGGNRTLTLLGTNTQANTLAAAIVDSGPTGVTSLAKAGEGTWIISGNSSFSGLTTVSAGTLVVASANALGATAPQQGNTNSAGTSVTGDTGGSGRLALSGGITAAAEPINLGARQGPTATIPHLLNVGGENHWTGPISLVAGGFEYNFQSDAGTLVIDTNITQTLSTLERFVNLQGAGNGVINGAIVNGGGTQVQSLRKRGAGTWTLNSAANSYRGATHVEGGTLTIGPAGVIAPDDPIITSAGATFRVEGSVTVPEFAGTGSTQITTSGRVTLTPEGGTSVFGDLQIPEVGPLAPGTLDINDNDLVVQSSAANKAADFVRLYGLLSTGFHGGDWLGRGITSSTAAANTDFTTGIAIVDNAIFGYTEFAGEPVTADSILFKYTYYGDIDANGQIDADDLTVFANNFGRLTGAAQIDGDIDFDGDVDADDLTVFANNFGKGIGDPLAAGTVAAVPEPTSFFLAGLGAAMLSAAWVRRRRRGRGGFR